MARLLKQLMLAMFLLLVTLMLAPTVYATQIPPPFTPAAGTATIVSVTPTEIKSFDGITIINFKGVTNLTGTFTGTTADVGTIKLRSSGDFTFIFRSTFTGTVNGKSGTVVFNVVGKGTGGVPGGSFQAKFTVNRGTNELANLIGMGDIEATAGNGTYSGQILFTGLDKK